MREINKLNYFIAGIPVILITAGWLFKHKIIFLGYLLSIITGGFQLIFGIGIYIDSNYKDKWIRYYLIMVTLYFLLYFTTHWFWLIALPPLLALYFSLHVFMEAKKERS